MKKREPSRAETHQTATAGDAILTTDHGTPISDNQNSLRAGARGPTLLEDFILREKIFHFDHERIPERIVHARGSGAHGVFECTKPIPHLTKASLFQKKGETIPVFVRFSTVAGNLGSKDTPRDVRGFATKFYTREGNWDLVGNNMPVFFIQDAIKFPDLVHAVKTEADRGFPQAASAHDTFWDFISLMPESAHMIMWLMSDRSLPRAFRMMEGFGVHTFRLVNAEGKGTFVKFHWKPALGMQSTTWDEAVKISGADPDYHRRDLWDSIERGAFPQWDFGVQVLGEELVESLPYDVLDATKIVPEELAPIEFVGRMTLNRNPDNQFAEVEQAAFMPQNVPPGIDFTNDPLLQGRLFSYLDTQKSRLGTANFHQIPINAPRCPMHNFQRDGMMQTMVHKGRASYEPNSLDQVGEEAGPRETPRGFATFEANGESNDATVKLRARAELFADHFSQARMFYLSQTKEEQDHLVAALIFELSKCELAHIRKRVVSMMRTVHEDIGARLADGLNVEPQPAMKPARDVLDLDTSDALSILKNAKQSLEGRHVAILFDAGSDKAEVEAAKSAVEAAGARVSLVAPKVGDNKVKGGVLTADAKLDGAPSVLFDGVGLVLSEADARKLTGEKAAVDFVSDAFAHLKAIAHTNGAKPLLDRAGVAMGEGVVALSALPEAAAKRYFAREKRVKLPQ